MEEPDHVDIEIDLRTLEAVIRSFNYIVENEIPDWQDMSLSSLDELLILTEKLKSFQGTSEIEATVPMSFSDWVVYEGFINYAVSVVPDVTDRDLLLSLVEKNEAMADDGIIPPTW